MTWRGEIFRYELPLLTPFPRGDQKVARGHLVAIRVGNERRFGEVADAALVEGESPNRVAHELHDALVRSRYSEEHCAPVRWALSVAHADLTFSGPVLLNAVLDASRYDCVDRALAAYAEGYRCFKIKIGDGDLNTEITRIVEMTKVLGKGITVRLDGNRKLSLEAALEFAKALRKVTIEYFEEPFSCLNLIEEFYAKSQIRIALDESVIGPEFTSWSTHQAVRAYVLKPARIGALDEVMRVIELAQHNNRDFIISSTYESSIGLWGLVKLASIRQSRPVAMGLATGSYFAADLVSPPLRPFRGHIVSGSHLDTKDLHSFDDHAGRFLRKLEPRAQAESCSA